MAGIWSRPAHGTGPCASGTCRPAQSCLSCLVATPLPSSSTPTARRARGQGHARQRTPHTQSHCLILGRRHVPAVGLPPEERARGGAAQTHTSTDGGRSTCCKGTAAWSHPPYSRPATRSSAAATTEPSRRVPFATATTTADALQIWDLRQTKSAFTTIRTDSGVNKCARAPCPPCHNNTG